MQAGRLRYRVTIESQVAGSPQKKASGAPDASWTTFATCWAAIEPLRGREFLEAQQIQSRIDVRIRIRYRDGITAAMRVLHGSTYYYVEAVIDPETRNRELQLMCSQGVANA